MPDSFQPDSFEPDNEDSFVADSFTPDEAPQQVTKAPPDWRTGGILDPNKNLRERLDVLLSGPDQLRDAFGKPDDHSLLPTLKQPETYWGGFFNSLYNDYVRPLASPEGFVGASNPVHSPALNPNARLMFDESSFGSHLPLKIYEPPTRAEPRGLLTAHEDPFIAGPGGVQRADLVTPQEQARLIGYPDDVTGPISTGDRSFGTTLDINELRERERLAALDYTNFEHTGGVSLEIPDKPFMQQPPVSGDTGLGFQPQSNADLPYPLNVVPNAVRPRSAQAVTEALAGDKFAAPIKPSEPVEFVSPKTPKEKLVKPEPDLAGGTASIRFDPTGKANEPMLPSAVKTSRARVKAETGIDVPDNVSIPASTPKPVADAVKAGTKEFIQQAGKPSSYMKSIGAQLDELGPAGKELKYRFQRASQNRAEYDAAWTEPLFAPFARLSKAEHANLGAYVEGRMPIPNARVQRAVDAWRNSESMMADMAESKGLHLKRDGNVIPFERVRENYWPHNPVPGQVADKKDLVEKLVADGMSRADAINVAKKWDATGEIFLRGQHSRSDKVFKYRDDADVAIEHARSMARRIANHENLGPKDIAGKGNAGIANLIEDTTDPKLAVKLAKRLAGREEKPSKELIDGLNKARKWSSLTSLANFTFKNLPLGQAVNAQMVALSRHPIEATKEVMKLFGSAYRDEIRASGALNSFSHSLAEELSGIDPFLIGAGEKINRGIAAAIGRSTVRSIFQDYKNGIVNPRTQYLLETLLARDPATIEKLTPEMERFAAGRMAEVTQGLNNPMNLPYHWSDPVSDHWQVAKQLSLIFKKIGFQTTKTVKDTVKVNPLIMLPAWAAISQVAGEMVGDVGSTLTGKERPENLGLRALDNWANAHMLGLVWDIATSAQYSPTALIGAAVGPVYSKGSELGYDTYATGRNLVTGTEDPWKPLRQFGLRNLPVPARERIARTVEED